MVYQHRFLHVFMSLFFFYVLACLLSVSIYLLIVARALYLEIMINPYIWMLYAPGPLFVGMGASLFLAGLVQWFYRCKVKGDSWEAKDTWGRVVVFDQKDIELAKTYNIPFMPLAKLTIKSCKCNVWVPTSALSQG